MTFARRIIFGVMLVGCSRHSTAPVAAIDASAQAAAGDASTDAAAIEASTTQKTHWTAVGDRGISCPDIFASGESIVYVGTQNGHPSELKEGNLLGARTIGAFELTIEMCNITGDESSIYVVDAGAGEPREGTVFRIDRDTGHTTPWFSRSVSLRQVAIDDRAVYTVAREEKSHVLLKIDKKNARARNLAKFVGTPSGMGSTADEILLSTCVFGVPPADQASGCMISVTHKVSGKTKTLRKDVGPAYSFATEGSIVYIPDATKGTVSRVDLDSDASAGFVIGSDLGEIRGLQLDADWLYVTSNLGLFALKRDGARKLTLDSLDGAGAVAVHGDEIYVLTGQITGMFELPVVYSTMFAGADARLVHASKHALFAAAP